MFQNTLEAEPQKHLKDVFWPIVSICSSIWFSIQRIFDNTLLELILIIFLVTISFILFNQGWVIIVDNINKCVFLEQQCKTIICIAIIFRSEFIQNICTEMYLLHILCNRSNCGISCHYRISIKHINRVYVIFYSQWQIPQCYLDPITQTDMGLFFRPLQGLVCFYMVFPKKTKKIDPLFN